MKTWKNGLISLLIIGVAIAVVAILVKTKPVAKQKLANEQTWRVNSQTLASGNFSPHIKLFGQLISSSEIKLSANVEANVVHRYIETGDRVKAGQLLIKLDSFEQQQQLNLRTAELNEIQTLLADENKKHEQNLKTLKKEKELLKIAKTSVKRTSTLEKSAMASSSQREDAQRNAITQEITLEQRIQTIDTHPIRVRQLQARLAQAKARLALSQKDLDDTKIYSPVNGIVRNIEVNQGEFIHKGNTVVTLIDTDALEIKALLPKKYISLISHDMTEPKAQMSLNKKLITLHFLRIANYIDKGQAGATIYLKPTVPLSAGLTVGEIYDVYFMLPTIEHSFVIPQEALYGINSVFIIKDQRLVRVPVTWRGEVFDSRDHEKLLITSNQLHDGDTILTSKFATAINGLKVEINHHDH